jgi:hypothetical protein
MPRKSAEARSAAVFLATPLEPPTDLDPRAAELWWEIVRSHPADWWNGGSLTLLRRFCRTAGHVERIHDALAQEPIGSSQSGVLHRQMVSGNQSLGALASKMRINQQAMIDRRSGHITERPADKEVHELLGIRRHIQ